MAPGRIFIAVLILSGLWTVPVLADTNGTSGSGWISGGLDSVLSRNKTEDLPIRVECRSRVGRQRAMSAQAQTLR